MFGSRKRKELKHHTEMVRKIEKEIFQDAKYFRLDDEQLHQYNRLLTYHKQRIEELKK